MTSFNSSTLLKEGACCKFMSRPDNLNYFRRLMKTLSICFQRNTTQKDLVMRKYF